MKAKKITSVLVLTLIISLTLSTTAFAGGISKQHAFRDAQHEKYLEKYFDWGAENSKYGIFNTDAVDALYGDEYSLVSTATDLTLEDAVTEIAMNLFYAGKSEEAYSIITAPTLKEAVVVAGELIKKELASVMKSSNSDASTSGWYFKSLNDRLNNLEGYSVGDIVSEYIQWSLVGPIGS